MASWVIPCNPKFYDAFGAFRNLETVDWRQVATSIEAGDTIYVYIGHPIQAITHKCLVLDANIPYEEIDHSDDHFTLADEDRDPNWRYMRLKLEKEYAPNVLSYSRLIEFGLRGSIQSQQHVNTFIQAAIDSIDS